MFKAKAKRALALPLVAFAIFLPVLAACGSGGAAAGGGGAGTNGDEPVSSPPVTSAPSSSPADGGRPARKPSSSRRTVLDERDGVISRGMAVSVFDDELPAVGRLDPDLLDSLRRAARDAKADGVGFRVNSGWRSPEYQRRLLRGAIVKYGSQEEAARWVSTPETSAHVQGEAVDIGPSRAAAWLSEHGAAYGLCQIYGNEPWHYELRPDAVDDGCPPMYADPTEDPRMRA